MRLTQRSSDSVPYFGSHPHVGTCSCPPRSASRVEYHCARPAVRSHRWRSTAAEQAQSSQVIERAADKAQPSPLKLHQQNGAQHIHIPHSEQLHPVSEPTKPSITLHYATGWRNPSIHGAINGQAWQDFPMIQVGSSGGHWSMLNFRQLPSQQQDGQPLLEFVVHGDHGAWDKPQQGGNYIIDKAGSYQLSQGRVQPITVRPCLVVSDVDDTMVGDDAASLQFKAWWERDAAGHGSRLVYNTGRALDSFQRLLAEKEHCMPLPDALITSVGTRVFQRQVDGTWLEDQTWSAQLEEGWHLDAVREATYHAVAAVGRDGMHFRPPEEQNSHKVTCGVHASIVDKVVQDISVAVERAGVRAQFILSGKGEWRFLDIVAQRAGKLAALEYVRQQMGFLHQHTIACGDSGNDKDMLAGANLAIVVGNAQPDMKAWIHEVEQRELPLSNSKRSRMIVTQAHRAMGILEGLEYFGFK